MLTAAVAMVTGSRLSINFGRSICNVLMKGPYQNVLSIVSPVSLMVRLYELDLEKKWRNVESVSSMLIQKLQSY